MRGHADRVRRYYDRNSRWMLLLGQGRGEAAIHRQVWNEGVASRKEALHTVDRLIAEALLDSEGQADRAKWLLDLGCGVGGTAVWLADHYRIKVTGVTLSTKQVNTAGKLTRRRGLADRCDFYVADFTESLKLSGITDAYAVEAFSHGENPAAFFSAIGELLPAGGRLALCDDFVTAEEIPSNKRDRWLSRFREGWHLPSLMTEGDTLSLARRHGFVPVYKSDLTSCLQFDRASIHLLQRLARPIRGVSVWGASVYGGAALHVCQKNGWTEYLFLVLEKR